MPLASPPLPAREAHQISVNRLEHIHPVWKDFILALNDLPLPHRFNILSKDESNQLHEWLAATEKEQNTLEPLDPLDPLLEYKLYVSSYIHLHKCHFEQARRHASCLLEYAPQEPSYRLLLGLAAFGANDYQTALQQLDLALYYTPEHALSNAVNGFIAAFSRDHVKALRCTQIALQQHSQIDSWGGTRWLELTLFQSEHLLFGHSSAGGLDSKLFIETSPQIHLEQLAKNLPPLHDYLDFVGEEQKDVLFVSCDNNYFHKYAIPLALSLVDCNSPLALHLHLVNPDDSAFDILKHLHNLLAGKLRATYERAKIDSICPPGIYYSCIRFCRLAQFKLSSAHDYALIDADMLINRSFTFSDVRASASNNTDCILIYSPHEPIWDCLLAGFCLFGPRAEGIITNISAFIIRSIQQKKSRWFLDQIALFLATQHSHEDLIGYAAAKTLCDLTHSPDSYIWAITTEKDIMDTSDIFPARAENLRRNYLPTPPKNR